MGTFSALALQMDCVAVNRLSERSQVEQAMTAAIHKVGQQIAGSKANGRSIMSPKTWTV